jgi:hypothetical protein
MIALVLGIFLVHASPQGTGVVTGVVRSSNGSPAAQVRVYAITYRDAVEAATLPPALEGLTETDASGRYRLELPPGRYHIATGSVAAPTYHPNTTDISAARVISVARDLVVQDIDFGTFVPASRTPGGPPPGNGVLSGVLRYSDGTPASGISVVATLLAAQGNVIYMTTTPTGTLSIATSFAALTPFNIRSGNQAVTDAAGAYQIPSLGPETYRIAAGYADAAVFYPGVPDAAAAKTVVLALNARIDKLDFTLPRRAVGVRISGRVSTTSGLPATSATVRLRTRDNPTPAVIPSLGLPLLSPPQTMNVAADGLFSFPDVLPGTFIVEVNYSGIPSQRQEVVVSGQPVNGLQVVLPMTMFTGRFVMEDGSPVPNPEVFGEAILTTASNTSTIMPISSTGPFSRLLEANEFRFYLRTLPEEYEIKSLKAGSIDLSKETLKISGVELVDVEIRVAKRSVIAGSARVSGTLRDSHGNPFSRPHHALLR